MELLFSVQNQHIERIDSMYPVADSIDYLTARFSFSTSDWEGLTKTAIFRNGDEVFNVILDTNNNCIVPWEVVKRGKLSVSLFAGNRITTDKCIVDIVASGYEPAPTPEEPTPTAYEQMVEILDGLKGGSAGKYLVKSTGNDYDFAWANGGGGGGGGEGTLFDFSMFNNFAVIGDSFASGEIHDNPSAYVANYEKSWGQMLARKYGNECINMSFSGATAYQWWRNPTYGKALLDSSDAQELYLIQLGINDSTRPDAVLGTLSDITSHSSPSDYPNTFYGNYGKIVEAIFAKSEKAKVILMTFACHFTETENSYNSAIIEMAQHYNIPYIDIRNDSYYTQTSIWYTSMISRHPIACTYSGMAKVNAKLIEECVRNNISYFKSLGYNPETPTTKTLTSITAVLNNPTVEQGQTYTPNATVTAHYDDSSSAVVTTGVSYSTIDTSTTGEKTLTISYTESGVTKTTTATVTVTAEPVQKTLSSISATKTKTSYTVGETFSNADVVVTAHYSDSSTATVTTSATIGTVDTSTEGSKTLSISYSEDGVTKTTTITITVIASGGEITYQASELTCVVTSANQKFGDGHTPWVQGSEYKYIFDYEVVALNDGVTINFRNANNASATDTFNITSTIGSTGHIEHTMTANNTRETGAFVGRTSGYTLKLTNITVTKLA